MSFFFTLLKPGHIPVCINDRADEFFGWYNKFTYISAALIVSIRLLVVKRKPVKGESMKKSVLLTVPRNSVIEISMRQFLYAGSFRTVLFRFTSKTIKYTD
jgi:hypothetical protein